MENLNELYVTYFATFSLVAGTTLPFVIEWVNRVFELTTSAVKSIVSWAVPVVLMYAGWGLGHFFEGFLSELPYWHPLVYGAWAGLMANIEWTAVPWLKTAVTAFFEWLLKK